jgi:hypothetical protein
MPAQKGKDLLLKIGDDGSFVTVAGLRTKTLAFNAQTVDVTHANRLDAGVNSYPARVCAALRFRHPEFSRMPLRMRWCEKRSLTARHQSARS